MATSSSKTLDRWREVFRAAGESDVFHVIRQAIRDAASNHPDEFRIRKDKIVQMLFTAIPRVEKADEGHRNAVEAIEVKAIEKEEKKSGRGNPGKSYKALLAARNPPSAEEESPRAAVAAAAAVAVFEEKTETKREETWKILSVSKNGKIRLRRVLHDQTKPSKPQTTFTDHQPDEPRNLEGSLPTFTDHQPDEPRNDQETSHHPEPRSDDQDGPLRSNLETAKRKVSECFFPPFEPRPKKFCRRPLQFRISGARLR